MAAGEGRAGGEPRVRGSACLDPLVVDEPRPGGSAVLVPSQPQRPRSYSDQGFLAEHLNGDLPPLDAVCGHEPPRERIDPVAHGEHGRHPWRAAVHRGRRWLGPAGARSRPCLFPFEACLCRYAATRRLGRLSFACSGIAAERLLRSIVTATGRAPNLAPRGTRGHTRGRGGAW